MKNGVEYSMSIAANEKNIAAATIYIQKTAKHTEREGEKVPNTMNIKQMHEV